MGCKISLITSKCYCQNFPRLIGISKHRDIVLKYRESKDSSRHAVELDPENNATSLQAHASSYPLDEKNSISSKVTSNTFDPLYLSNRSITQDECKMNDIQKQQDNSRSNGNETLDDDHKAIESKLKDNTGNSVQWIF